jgi:hypothetical protein
MTISQKIRKIDSAFSRKMMSPRGECFYYHVFRDADGNPCAERYSAKAVLRDDDYLISDISSEHTAVPVRKSDLGIISVDGIIMTDYSLWDRLDSGASDIFYLGVRDAFGRALCEAEESESGEIIGHFCGMGNGSEHGPIASGTITVLVSLIAAVILIVWLLK